jgi:hypothetical protein
MDEHPEDAIDEAGRNPTQRRIDEDGTTDEPVDMPWGTSEDIPEQPPEETPPAQ